MVLVPEADTDPEVEPPLDDPLTFEAPTDKTAVPETLKKAIWMPLIYETPAPAIIASLALLNQTVAKPRAARLRLPVLAVPARRRVRPDPCVIVIAEALSL